MIPISGHVAFFNYEYYFVETLDVCLGWSNKSANGSEQGCQPFTVSFDLASSTIMLPNARISEQHTFGYSCSPLSHCQLDAGLSPCRYNLTEGLCNEAAVPLSLFSTPMTTSPDMPGMNFSLMNYTEDWELGKYGILGLSPMSPFWQYLREIIKPVSRFASDKDLIQVSLNYKLLNMDQVYRLDQMILFDSYLELNSVNVERNSITVAQPANATNWVYQDLELVRFSDDPPSKFNACVSNTMNYFLYTENFTSFWKPRILRQLCGNETECLKHNSVVGDVENIYLTLYTPGNDESRIKVILDPNSFIKFDEQNRSVIILGDVTADTSSSCPTGTQLILGRLFFSKVNMVIKVMVDGSFQVGLYKAGDAFRIFFFLGTLVVVNMLAIVTTLLVMRAVRRNSQAYVEGSYRAIIDNYRRDYDMLRPDKKALAISQPAFDLHTFTVKCRDRGTY